MTEKVKTTNLKNKQNIKLNKYNETVFERTCNLIDKLASEHSLDIGEYEGLVSVTDISNDIAEKKPEKLVLSSDSSGTSNNTCDKNENFKSLAAYAAKLADETRREIFGTEVYIRGLIEIGNVCKNDCFYCGIRKSNKACERYILDDERILACCKEGYGLGFRTFVLQGGEGSMPVERICETVRKIKSAYKDCAVTLSLGEYSKEDYKSMFDAGADRYLLRHETADKEHYEKLHPKEMSFENRMRCLKDLKDLGFQTGCGFMVGSPFQTAKTLAKDLKFIEEFQPHMCGIGPFIPQHDTPFGSYKAGTADMTIYLLSLIRLIKPDILLPATTALGTIEEGGRERGMKAGANVVMPNLSPVEERKKYALYDNKLSSGKESAQNLEDLKKSVRAAGYEIVESRGDAPMQCDTTGIKINEKLCSD